MKNIIVPTDFSDCAKNALRYASNLAELMSAKLTVLYVQKPSVAVIDTLPMELIYTENADVPAIVHENMRGLKNFLSTKPNVQVDYLIKQGDLNEEILARVKDSLTDLIVMGTEGVEDAYNMMWGSNTSELIGKRKCPVLVVPLNYLGSLEKGAKFIFATDFEAINDWYVLNFFKALAQKLEASIKVFYVVDHAYDEKELLDFENIRFKVVKEFFENTKVELQLSNEKDVVGSVEKFAHETRASLVSMISHDRNFIENIFHKSITKGMALNTSLPFLAIPDVHNEKNLSYDVGYW